MGFAKVNEVLIGIFNANIYIKGIPNIHHEPKIYVFGWMYI